MERGLRRLICGWQSRPGHFGLTQLPIGSALATGFGLWKQPRVAHDNSGSMIGVLNGDIPFECQSMKEDVPCSPWRPKGSSRSCPGCRTGFQSHLTVWYAVKQGRISLGQNAGSSQTPVGGGKALGAMVSRRPLPFPSCRSESESHTAVVLKCWKCRRTSGPGISALA